MRIAAICLLALLSVMAALYIKYFPEPNTSLILKAAAIEALGNIGERSSVTVISKYLNDKQFLLQNSALDALGKISGPKAVLLLKQKINDKNKRIAVQAAGILFDKADARIRAVYTSGFDSPDSGVRTQAIETAMAVSIAQSVPKIVAALGDKNNSVRLKAVQAITSLDPENPAACGLIAGMTEDPDTQIRNAAVMALGESANKEYIPIIKARLKDKEEMIVASAKIALEKLGGEPVAAEPKEAVTPEEELEEEIIDTNSPLYAAQLYILAERSDFSVIPKAIEALKSPGSSAYIKISAVNALKKIREKLITSLASRLTADDKLKSCQGCLDISFNIDNISIKNFFLKSLKDKNSPCHKDAPRLIAEWQDESMSPALVEALKEDGKEGIIYTSSIIYAIGMLKDKSASGLIERFLAR